MTFDELMYVQQLMQSHKRTKGASRLVFSTEVIQVRELLSMAKTKAS